MIKAGELDYNTPQGEVYTPAELELLDQEPWRQLHVSPMYAILVNVESLTDRLLFNTRDGRFGFSSKGVQAGDLLCVLNGSPTPHVVRKTDDREGEERYVFVGDAYVHGLMHGEVDSLGIAERELVFV